MTRIFVSFILWTLCGVARTDQLQVTATATDKTTTVASDYISWPVKVPISSISISSSSSQVSSASKYSQGEMADDEKVDPEKIRVLDIVVYTFLFAIGAPANFKIIKCLVWTQNSVKLYRKSRHHFLLFNLAVADAIVLFIVLPTEVFWRVTASWRAGNIGCKLFQFFRVFGLYASSMILICISLDRYYAVVQPFKYSSAANRISRLLKASWILSAIFSFPQLYFFRLQKHPRKIEFNQCVSFDTFEETWLEKSYAISHVTALYCFPLLVILICYIQICIKSFSRKHCKPSKKPSVLGASTNEPLGASSICVPIHEAEDYDEDEAQQDDDNDDEKMIHCTGVSDNKRSKENTGSGEDESFNEANSVDTSNEVKVTLSNKMPLCATDTTARSSKGENAESGRHEKEDEAASSSSPSSSSTSRGKSEKKMHTLQQSEQCILMKNLSHEKSPDHNKSTEVSVKVSSSVMDSQKNKHPASPCKSHLIDDDKISEALVSGKCSNCDGVNFSTSIITGTGHDKHKSRYKKQSEVRKSILRQTLIIILAFIICWTPYAIVVLWYQCDREGFKESGHQSIEMFWLFAVSNSAVNPFIYGKFVKSKGQK